MCELLTTDSLGTPIPRAALKHLAAAAHEVWRGRMLAEGWKPGKRFDADARTHDALVPFRELGYDDRWAAVEAVAGFDGEDELAELIDYPRGEDRPLTLADMKVGLRVMPGWCPAIDAPPAARGRVVSWRTRPGTRRLGWVRVRWDDGHEDTHVPAAYSIRRA